MTTYRFEGQVNSPVYGQHSLSEIQITLETAVDPAGVKEQVLRVKIPASVIPPAGQYHHPGRGRKSGAE